MQHRRRNIEEQIRANRQELQVMQVRLESMHINVPELSAIGKDKVICSNCHHRGHRNEQTKPCIMERCLSFTYCGIKGKLPEYTAEMNKMKCSIKKKSDAIKQLEEELEGINNFQSQSEHQFIKAFTLRMLKVNPEYKTNRPKLLRDIRILRQFLGGKIPQETTNDPEQLRITIAKCKHMLQDEVGDVGILGITEHERTQASGNAPKFDVTMNMSRMSPVENNGKVLTEKQCINPNCVDTKLRIISKMRGKSIPERTKSRKSVNVKVNQFTTPDGSRSSSSDQLHSRKQPKKASTRRKRHYNQHLHSMTSFTHLPVTQTSDLNTTAGEQALGKTTVTEGTKRPHEGSSGLNLLSAAYLMQDKS